MKEYKRWDRIVFKHSETHWWYPKPGTGGVINRVGPDTYEVGLDTGNYIYISKKEAEEVTMLDSKLYRILS